MRQLRIVVAGVLSLTPVLATSVAAAPAVLLETARLTPSDGAPEGGFGRDVAIHGDVAVVTANEMLPYWGSGPALPGAAYVYERNSAGLWQQTAKLTPQPATTGDLFGHNVAVEGNVIVVGAPFSRLTYVFEKSASGWSQTAVLGGLGAATGNGSSVAIEDGIIAIGDDSPHGLSLYRRGTSGWSQIAGYENGLGMPDVDYFGPDVDVTGRFAIHGSWGSDSAPTPGTAFIYDAGVNANWSNPVVTQLTRPGVFLPDGFSSNVALEGSTALISGDVFERNSSGTWAHTDFIPGGGQALDGDAQTVISGLVRYRFSTIHRRGGSGSWAHAGNLVASDGAMLSLNSIDQGRVLATTAHEVEPAAAAYLYELPSNLERPPLSQDDFEDGDATGWSTTPGSGFVVTPENASLVYRQTTTSGNAAALLQSSSGNDQSIQVDVTPWIFNGPDRWFGLVARYSDANNYYYVTARSGGGVQLKKMVGGSYTTLASAPLSVAIGHRNRLRLEAIGNHVRVLVDDRPVIHVRDSSLSSGVSGLMTFRTAADFDNVVFNTNPANLAFSYDFETMLDRWTKVSGQWSRAIANGSYVERQSDLSGNAHTVISTTLKIDGDQIVKADLRPTQFSGADRWLGLLARYVDDSNYYYITMRSSNTLLLRKLVNGVVHTFGSAPLTVDLNRTYRVRLESVGAHLRAYVDDELLLEAVDPNIPSEPSTAGVMMYKTAADVDNFAVIQP